MEQALYIYHFKNLHKIVCVIVQVLINKKKYREKKNPVTFSKICVATNQVSSLLEEHFCGMHILYVSSLKIFHL